MSGSIRGAEDRAGNKIPDLMKLTFKWGPQTQPQEKKNRYTKCERMTCKEKKAGKGRLVLGRAVLWGTAPME